MKYKFKNWDKNFEKADTRKCVHMKWVAIPNSLDGRTYRSIASNENNVSILAAWMLMLLVASKSPERGNLSDEQGSLGPKDLQIITGFPEEIFVIAIEQLVKLGCLEEVKED